jgi:hypothetical protein
MSLVNRVEAARVAEEVDGSGMSTRTMQLDVLWRDRWLSHQKLSATFDTAYCTVRMSATQARLNRGFQQKGTDRLGTNP